MGFENGYKGPHFGWSYFSDQNKDSCDTGGWENFVYINGRWCDKDDCICIDGNWAKKTSAQKSSCGTRPRRKSNS